MREQGLLDLLPQAAGNARSYAYLSERLQQKHHFHGNEDFSFYLNARLILLPLTEAKEKMVRWIDNNMHIGTGRNNGYNDIEVVKKVMMAEYFTDETAKVLKSLLGYINEEHKAGRGHSFAAVEALLSLHEYPSSVKNDEALTAAKEAMGPKKPLNL